MISWFRVYVRITSITHSQPVQLNLHNFSIEIFESELNGLIPFVVEMHNRIGQRMSHANWNELKIIGKMQILRVSTSRIGIQRDWDKETETEREQKIYFLWYKILHQMPINMNEFQEVHDI